MEGLIRDVRLVWANCKVYNSTGSPIWRVAATFAYAFEHLIAECVLAFKQNGVTWNEAGGRPWEYYYTTATEQRSLASATDPSHRLHDGRVTSADFSAAAASTSGFRPRRRPLTP